MAEAKERQSVFVTGGANGVGLATVRALLRRGHKVVATACNAEGALAVRQAGALPVYPDLRRTSEVLSTLQFAKPDAVIHAEPQVVGGIPHSSRDLCAEADQLTSCAEALVQASAQQHIKQLVAISFAFLYESGHGAAREGARQVRDAEYAPMLAAESVLLNSNLNGYLLRAGYIYGGNSQATADLAGAIKQSQALPNGANLASWIHEDDLATAIVTLVESEGREGMEILNVADGSPCSPNEFAIALSDALGLNAPDFKADGLFDFMKAKTMRDKLLNREIVIDSRKIHEEFGWTPSHASAAAGMEATSMVWRMQDAVNPRDFYSVYEDKAAHAIESMESGEALPEPVAVAEKPAAIAEAVAEKPAPVEAAAPPPSDGPTPWSEDDAKREERRLKALERKAKRAAKQSGGS